MGFRPLPAFLLLTTACTGNIGGEHDDGPPAPPDVTPLQVPASPDQVSGEGFCTALEAGESLQSVSPEGHAWIAKRDGDLQLVRIVDPMDEAATLSDELELGELLQVRAWSSGDASIVASDGLWRLEALARIQLTPPSEQLDAPSLCGDPGVNGFLLTDGLLFERRSDEHWWMWDPEVEGAGAPRVIVDYDGECLDKSDTMWLTAEDGTLWQIAAAQVFRPLQFTALVDAAATDGMLAILDSSKLWIGPETWQSWVFPGAMPAQLSASAGALWTASGNQVLRFDGESWVEVTHEMASPIVDVVAHAGGAWLVGESEICHVATQPMIRVMGLLPYSRSKSLDYEVSVSASDAVTVLASEEDAGFALDAETGMYTGTVRLDTVGWHDVVVSAGGTTRTIPVKRLPEVERSWATDIEPLYQANCTGSACHGGDTADAPPDFGSYEAWLSMSDEIRLRVVEAQSMPPAAAQTETWGAEQIDIVAQWLEGGMLP